MSYEKEISPRPFGTNTCRMLTLSTPFPFSIVRHEWGGGAGAVSKFTRAGVAQGPLPLNPGWRGWGTWHLLRMPRSQGC